MNDEIQIPEDITIEKLYKIVQKISRENQSAKDKSIKQLTARVEELEGTVNRLLRLLT